MLNWVNRFGICCFLDNHAYPSLHGRLECLAAAGTVNTFTASSNILPHLQSFIEQQQDWLFAHIGYDLKNEIENLHSSHPDHIGFPIVFFFQPETVLQLQHDSVAISSLTSAPENIFREISNEKSIAVQNPGINGTVPVRPRITKEAYIQTLGKILQHIRRGDCYEINFCQEFFAEEADVNPLQLYRQLTKISPNPFACFYRIHDKYLLCASPERYLQKKGNTVLSQPIKGTMKRDLHSTFADQALLEHLRQSEKDKSENVMVVDLVRNDLSRICKKGTVTVEELFGVYTFPQVHQMISTVKGELQDNINFCEIIKATFPMGSMTGAPKKRVMELIEQYECTGRGIYAGAVGYIDPSGDFDFNVMIRSIMYNSTDKYLNYLVGGGITYYSDPEKEYEECLLKAEAIKAVLHH